MNESDRKSMEVEEDFDSDDELMFDLANKNLNVWLVKIPKFLQEKWETAKGNQHVGNVRIYKNQLVGTSNKMEPKVTLHVPEAPWSGICLPS